MITVYPRVQLLELALEVRSRRMRLIDNAVNVKYFFRKET